MWVENKTPYFFVAMHLDEITRTFIRAIASLLSKNGYPLLQRHKNISGVAGIYAVKSIFWRNRKGRNLFAKSLEFNMILIWLPSFDLILLTPEKLEENTLHIFPFFESICSAIVISRPLYSIENCLINLSVVKDCC